MNDSQMTKDSDIDEIYSKKDRTKKKSPKTDNFATFPIGKQQQQQQQKEKFIIFLWKMSRQHIFSDIFLRKICLSMNHLFCFFLT